MANPTSGHNKNAGESHANQLNPNADSHQKALDNHAKQLNPNNPENKGK